MTQVRVPFDVTAPAVRFPLARASLSPAPGATDVLSVGRPCVGVGDEGAILWHTIEAWWPAIEVLIATGVSNTRTEAANTGIKQIKRTGRGYRNPAHYQARILLAIAARRAA